MEPVAESTLAVLSNVNSEQISSALRPLQSVLHVSTSKSVVSALHSSFLEFLQSDLAGPLRCDYASHNKLLATQCFAIIERQLRFNICSLEVPYRFDNDVQGFSRHARKSVPPELFYALQYWAYHLQSSRSCDQFVLCLDEFFRKQLMFWVEALNLKRFINRGPRALIEALKWLQKNGNSPEILELQDFIRDACSFTTAFAVNPVCRSTPHLYLSMLPLIPVQNRVRANYRPRSPGILWLNGTTMSRREGVALATWEACCGVTAVAYSPDSMRIAYGFNSLAFSPDGARLISSSRDRTIRMWDTRTGAALEFCKSYAQDISSVAFSPDGTLVVAGGDDCTVHVWDSNSGILIHGPLENHTVGVTVIIFSPDSTKCASGSYDRTIRVWLTNADGATLGPTHAFKGHTAGILAIAFSPDGDSLVSGSLDRTIRIWSSANGTPLSKPFEGHTDAVSAVVFSCDGTKAISGSWDCTVCVWNAIDSAQISGPFTGHAQGVTCLSICPNGGSIVSGSWDGSIHFWDPHSNFTRDFDDHGHTQAITCVQFSPDGNSIISASEDSLVCIWDIETGDRRIKTNKGHIGKVNSVTFSPDGRQFLTGGDDLYGGPKNPGALWSAPVLGTSSLGSDESGLLGEDLRALHEYFRAPVEDCVACLWDSETGAMIGAPLAGHESGITSVAFSSNGSRIATSSYDSMIFIWDTRSAEVVNCLRGHTQNVTAVMFSPDGSHIVSGSWDNTVRLWVVNTGGKIARTSTDNSEIANGHSDIVTCVAFSSDSTRIASGSYDETVQIWNCSGNGPLLAKLFQCHVNAVVSVVFLPDSTQIVTGSRDGTIRIWDAQRGILIFDQFTRHTDVVNSIAFAPDGRRIVSGSTDCTIRIWEVPDEYNERRVWAINNEGWLMDPDQRPILWVPGDIRREFPRPPNTHVFSSRGSIIISPSKVDLALGQIWSQPPDIRQ
ncbi:WD40 repeat-like protein, partial [Rhizoctonia solani]